MSRYFYYITFINMVTSMTASMPKILLMERDGGAIVSILVSVPIGLVVCYLIGRFYQNYPGKGLPELMDDYIPKWIKLPFLFIIGVVWFVAGLLSVVMYSFFIKRFLAPNANLTYIVSMILLFIYYGALMKSKKILYILELIFIFTVPFIMLLIFKGFTTDYFEIDYVMVAVMHIQNYPTYDSICAASFIFWGPANLIIFNQVLTKKQEMSWKSVVIIGLFGAGVLLTSYFSPIGLLGFENVGTVINPGITASDTLQFRYGIIERVLFVVLTLFLAITFASMLTHWHVALEVLKNVIYFEKFQWKKHNLTSHLFLVLFWIISLRVVTYLSEYQLVKYTSYFYNLFPALLTVMFLLFWMIRRRAKA
ncbi:GerAB/ArcD/ProY family transporter [Bacillus tuaregi]|uniref:GerAB/ArcD/ProY family transporter n=1 Tax=Bacillus tuaregi TaxID=1816695 RepID=UPI0008F94D63|nr:GerAB/ArcD/ProY family transporter [Bacillus tuaregi]